MIQLLVVILTMEDIKKAIGEAEKELEVAERLVASKRSALMASVFLLGWLTFSFRLGPTCTVQCPSKRQNNGKCSGIKSSPSRYNSKFHNSFPKLFVNTKQLYHFI